MTRIGVVGDYQPTKETHRATTASLNHAGDAVTEGAVNVSWLRTDEVARGVRSAVAGMDGLVIAPGSPYRSMEGVLAVIQLARTEGIPLLATCGGFQHVALEFARNVLGIGDASHAEYDPYASTLFITPLSCSLAGKEMALDVLPDTVAGRAYGPATVTERYYCNFGLNPEHLPALVGGGLVVSGIDDGGEVRILELPGHPFFVATLFVPQTSSSPRHPHPLIESFVGVAASLPAAAGVPGGQGEATGAP